MPENDPQPTKIVVVGHVDHGKSTFIGRFLHDTGNLSPDKMEGIRRSAQDAPNVQDGRPPAIPRAKPEISPEEKIEFAHVMDQFREERERKITIDTAQTFFHLNGRPFLFVDAPGHKEYLKNMITGATQADHGLLLLDVREGIRSQTRVHARILKLIGIRRPAVLINKMDTVGYEEAPFRTMKEAISSVLSDEGLAPSCVVPLSALEGENVAVPGNKMAWYEGPTAKDFIESIPVSKRDSTESGGGSLFPVQMIYSVDDTTAILGRVERGGLRTGQDLYDFSSGNKFFVKKILKHKTAKKRAEMGESVALILDSIDGLDRGSVLMGDSPASGRRRSVRAHVFWGGSSPLRVEDSVTMECRTQSGRVRIKEIRDQIDEKPLDELKRGELALMRLQLEDSLYLEDRGARHPFSRFVLFRNKEAAGCGVVETVAASLAVMVIARSDAFAYIDPGTGMAFVSGIGAWVAAGAAFVIGGAALFFRKWVAWLKRIFKKFLPTKWGG